MAKYAIALDVGATKIRAGIVVRNKILKTIKRPTQSKLGKKVVLKNIRDVITKLKQEQTGQLEKIGVGIAGQVDRDQGLVRATGNFKADFKNVKLAGEIKKKWRVPVTVDNDVKCFTRAENAYGAGRGLQNVVGLTLGTGIGGGVVMNGQMWRGKNNTAGEFGHMKISGQWVGNLPTCGLGEKYCWESVASGRAWQGINKKYGKKKADEIIVFNIVTGLLNICYIINPEVIILGGGLLEHPDILPKIKKEFKKRALWSWLTQTKIVRAKLGDEAILLGALM